MNEAYTPSRRAYGLRRRIFLLTGAFCVGAFAATPQTPMATSPVPRSTLSPAAWTRETTFGEAIDSLRRATKPPLNIIVLWRPIGESADIFRETSIGFDSIPGLRVRQYMDLLLLSLSAGTVSPLSYVVDGGAIIVATNDVLPAPQSVPRVYDVSDLVAAPSYAPSPGTIRRTFGGGAIGGYGQGLGQSQGTGTSLGGYGGYTTGTGLQGLVGSLPGGRR